MYFPKDTAKYFARVLRKRRRGPYSEDWNRFWCCRGGSGQTITRYINGVIVGVVTIGIQAPQTLRWVLSWLTEVCECLMTVTTAIVFLKLKVLVVLNSISVCLVSSIPCICNTVWLVGRLVGR